MIVNCNMCGVKMSAEKSILSIYRCGICSSKVTDFIRKHSKRK